MSGVFFSAINPAETTVPSPGGGTDFHHPKGPEGPTGRRRLPVLLATGEKGVRSLFHSDQSIDRDLEGPAGRRCLPVIPPIRNAYDFARQSETMRHRSTRFGSGCAAICAISRKMSRYRTPDPRNVPIHAPSRLLMVHRSTHLGRETHERTRHDDVRTRGIDERTRLGHEGTRVLRTNPRGQDVAGGAD